MSLVSLAMFALTELTLCLSPGPAVLCVVSQATSHGLRAAFAGIVGILSINALYFVLSAAGLITLLATYAPLYVVIRYAGSGYLLYVGVKKLYISFAREAAKGHEGTAQTRGHLLAQGVATQLANPKAVVYFTAVLPQFVAAEEPVSRQFLTLGVISILIEFPVLLLYGWVSARGRQLLRREGLRLWCNRLAGLFLVCAGLRLAFVY